jgi:hypothetical protein
MPKFWESGLAFFICLPTNMIPQPAKPLSTQYVTCGQNDKGVDVASREVKTPVFTSKTGVRAFGVVAAAKISNMGGYVGQGFGGGRKAPR